MLVAILAILIGFALLVYSADRFVEGAATTAKYAAMPPLLIGMLVVGFGTSAPEMLVSAMAAADNSPALAFGNAVGSNIVNIGLIVAVTALIAPICVKSTLVRKELPILLLASLVLAVLMWDGDLTRIEAIYLLIAFALVIGWSIFHALKSKQDNFSAEVESELTHQNMSLKHALLWLFFGLALLIASSKLLVWGAVSIAQTLGVSDLVIGLTIVALGTSLPELAASIIAAKKGEHDIAIGNIVGSNLFNTLAVIGIAGVIQPIQSLADVAISRDWFVMMLLTLLLWLMAFGLSKEGRINRLEGCGLLAAFIAYNCWLVFTI